MLIINIMLNRTNGIKGSASSILLNKDWLIAQKTNIMEKQSLISENKLPIPQVQVEIESNYDPLGTNYFKLTFDEDSEIEVIYISPLGLYDAIKAKPNLQLKFKG